jgi:hypothetical protein
MLNAPAAESMWFMSCRGGSARLTACVLLRGAHELIVVCAAMIADSRSRSVKRASRLGATTTGSPSGIHETAAVTPPRALVLRNARNTSTAMSMLTVPSKQEPRPKMPRAQLLATSETVAPSGASDLSSVDREPLGSSAEFAATSAPATDWCPVTTGGHFHIPLADEPFATDPGARLARRLTPASATRVVRIGPDLRHSAP